MLNSPPSFHSGVAAFACAALQAKADGEGGIIQPGSAGVSPVVLHVSRSTSERIKSKIAAFGDNWERLDASGLYCVQANNCQRKITALEKELKELTEEDY